MKTEKQQKLFDDSTGYDIDLFDSTFNPLGAAKPPTTDNDLTEAERAKLVDSAMKYAVKLARQRHEHIKRNGVEIDLSELVSEAKLALVEQSRVYDPKYKSLNGKATFTTFAHWAIMNKLAQYVQSNKAAFVERPVTNVKKLNLDAREAEPQDLDGIIDGEALGENNKVITHFGDMDPKVRDAELLARLRDAGEPEIFGRLGEVTRTVIWLFLCRGIPFPCIAEQMGLNLAEVQTVARNVLRSIRLAQEAKAEQAAKYAITDLFSGEWENNEGDR